MGLLNLEISCQLVWSFNDRGCGWTWLKQGTGIEPCVKPKILPSRQWCASTSSYHRPCWVFQKLPHVPIREWVFGHQPHWRHQLPNRLAVESSQEKIFCPFFLLLTPHPQHWKSHSLEKGEKRRNKNAQSHGEREVTVDSDGDSTL